MILKNTALRPLHRAELKERFGSLAFQCVLINIDVYGIKILRTDEVVVILYSGGYKTGFLYEGGNLTQEQVFAVYKDAPKTPSDFESWANQREGKVDVLVPPKYNYVFIDDKQVVMIKPKTIKK